MASSITGVNVADGSDLTSLSVGIRSNDWHFGDLSSVTSDINEVLKTVKSVRFSCVEIEDHKLWLE